MFTVYVLYNRENDKIYIGQTANINKRIIEHNDPNNSLSKYTKKISGEWEIIYKEIAITRKLAMKRERELKSFRGREVIRKNIQNLHS